MVVVGTEVHESDDGASVADCDTELGRSGEDLDLVSDLEGFEGHDDTSTFSPRMTIVLTMLLRRPSKPDESAV